MRARNPKVALQDLRYSVQVKILMQAQNERRLSVERSICRQVLQRVWRGR
jgi:hypothetical protein